MPTEPSPYWWPLAVTATAIVGIGAVWFTQWVIGRLEKDRTKLHDHATKIQLHEYRLDDLEEKDRGSHHHKEET